MKRVVLGLILGGSLTLNCVSMLLLSAAGKGWSEREKEYKKEIESLKNKLEEANNG